VAFYVPLGPRGLVFRLGTFIIGIWGGLIYRLAYHRRSIILHKPGLFSSVGPRPRIYRSPEETPSLPSPQVMTEIFDESETAAQARFHGHESSGGVGAQPVLIRRTGTA
jgi:hypothetical protein